MFKLYWAPNTGAFAPQVALQEAATPYQLVPVNLAAGEHRAPAFLALNPRGEIPVLQAPDGLLLTESAAIVLHIADCYPAAELLPAPGSVERARTYRWLLYAATSLYGAFLRYYHPERVIAQPAAEEAVKQAALAEVRAGWAILAADLQDGPFVLGTRYSIVDTYLVMLAYWDPDPVTLFGLFPALARLCQAVRRRPAVAALWDDNFPQQ